MILQCEAVWLGAAGRALYHYDAWWVYSPLCLDEIIKAIQDAGLSILHMMAVCLSQADVEKLYRKLQDKPFFNQLVDFMCR